MMRLGRLALVVVLLAAQLGLTREQGTALDVLTCGQGLDLSGSKLVFPVNEPGTPAPSGGIFPILFVHGFNSDSSTWTRPAMVSWQDPPTNPTAQSFVDMVQNIPGAYPVLFDYRDHSLDWVTKPAIAGALSIAINCLATQSKQQVDVVAHSMGGLATREALRDPVRAHQVSTVVTFGTPNLGSFLPIAAADMSIGAAAVNRLAQTSAALGMANITTDAFLSAYHSYHEYLTNCARMIAAHAASGVCGDFTPLAAATSSDAGRGLAAGSQELSDLPRWPSSVHVLALATNYTGFGADDYIGDGVVYPMSAYAGAGQHTAATCELLDKPWVNELGPRRNGCWHPDEPANQNIIPIAITRLRDDITARDTPPLDPKNALYAITCDGAVPAGFWAKLQSGLVTVSGQSAGSSDYDHLDVRYEASAVGDIAGSGQSQTIVLLSCSPQPSNFVTQEVEVLKADGSVLAELPGGATLQNGAILPPQYIPGELAYSNGDISAGMMAYGPGDSHASGPSQHETFLWHWNGSGFDRVS